MEKKFMRHAPIHGNFAIYAMILLHTFYSTCSAQAVDSAISPNVIGYIFSARIIERIIVTIVGGISLYLGYRLFDKVTSAESSLEASGIKDIKISFTKIAPGIYFAAFGTFLLTYITYTKPTYSTSPNSGTSNAATTLSGVAPIAAGSDRDRLINLIEASNTIQQYTSEDMVKILSDEEKKNLRSSVIALMIERNSWFDKLYGEGSYNKYARYEALSSSASSEFSVLPNTEKAWFVEAQDLLTRTIK